MEARSLLLQTRYQQTANQVRQIQRSSADSGYAIAAYTGRDDYTGTRTLTTADGGTLQARYLSDSVPMAVPSLVRKGAIGVPGFMQQHPAGK